MSKLKRCRECEETFSWDDDVIRISDDVYHKKCVELYPTGYVAFIDGNFIGETENDDGSSAYDILDEGEYEEESA